jgi:hypothetical protein
MASNTEMTITKRSIFIAVAFAMLVTGVSNSSSFARDAAAGGAAARISDSRSRHCIWRQMPPSLTKCSNGTSLSGLPRSSGNRSRACGSVANSPGRSAAANGESLTPESRRKVRNRTNPLTAKQPFTQSKTLARPKLCRSRSRYACSCRSPGCADPGSPPRNICGLASVSIPASPNRSSARWCAPPSACGTTELPQGA